MPNQGMDWLFQLLSQGAQSPLLPPQQSPPMGAPWSGASSDPMASLMALIQALSPQGTGAVNPNAPFPHTSSIYDALMIKWQRMTREERARLRQEHPGMPSDQEIENYKGYYGGATY